MSQKGHRKLCQKKIITKRVKLVSENSARKGPWKMIEKDR